MTIKSKVHIYGQHKSFRILILITTKVQVLYPVYKEIENKL